MVAHMFMEKKNGRRVRPSAASFSSLRTKEEVAMQDLSPPGHHRLSSRGQASHQSHEPVLYRQSPSRVGE